MIEFRVLSKSFIEAPQVSKLVGIFNPSQYFESAVQVSYFIVHFTAKDPIYTENFQEDNANLLKYNLIDVVGTLVIYPQR